MALAPDFGTGMLSRVEDAGLNASAPPQQRWVDGWLLRYSPGKAKRARCINALTLGRLPVELKLAQCAAVFEQAGLPMVVRITPFSQPADLDERLASLGMARIDDTRVMVLPSLDTLPEGTLPPGWRCEAVQADDYAATVGAWRGSPAAQQAAHAERLRASPVQYIGFVLRADDGHVAACGQFARETDLVGLYDVFTVDAMRGRGLARLLCTALLRQAREQGARSAYLQVESDNHPARAVYQRLGFADGYGYHYRTPAADER